jgi:glycerol-3-phosphate dehydrogenase subunit C
MHDDNLIANKKVAYYAGCFANYYYPEVGVATVEIMAKNEIEMVVPDQVCCALPMVAKGNIKSAYKNMRKNVDSFLKYINDVYAVISTCSSCTLMIKRDYPHLLESKESEIVSSNTYHFSEYLLKLHALGLLDTHFNPIYQSIYYHTPCHLRAQEIGQPSIRLLQLIPGTNVKYISEECCGMGGAYGYEKANYQLSKEIAEKLYVDIKEHPTDRIVTDCGGCRLQIQSGTGRKVDHPVILVEEAYGLNNKHSNKPYVYKELIQEE